MDPTTLYNQILIYLQEEDEGDAVEGIDNLLHWLECGGFPPEQFSSASAARDTLKAMKFQATPSWQRGE